MAVGGNSTLQQDFCIDNKIPWELIPFASLGGGEG